MECNKEEAIRAKTIAEEKFANKDFSGAKKFTLKSQNLYPGLDGISQMLITLNVHIASENKINGESDWYGVLDVKPSDDDETIRKQYRKLVLMLHPDKNKSVGADGAFKILSEAWGLLSDNSKRSAYNQRRRFQQVSPRSVRSSTSSSATFVKVVPRATSKPKGQNSTTSTQTPAAHVPPIVPARSQAKTQAKARAKPRTQAKAQPRTQAKAKAQPPKPAAPVVNEKISFWTVCHECKMNYEFYKMYLNQTLICPGCHKAFHAVEMPTPADMPKPGGLCNKTNIRSSSRPEVQFNTPPSGASKAAASFSNKVNMNRTTCEESNAQRLSKRRKD